MSSALTEDFAAPVPGSHWKWPAVAAVATAVGILILLRESVLAMVMVWQDSPTFSYGYAVVPISLWLIWDKRRQLIQIEPSPAFWVLGLVLLSVLVWLLAHLLGFTVAEQFAMIAVLLTVLWSILGTDAVRVIAFPLGFLFIAVPIVPLADALIPLLMEITTEFVVKMFQFSGIPIYQENNLIHLPSGSWIVSEACSGIRYTIASVVLGILFAYLNYRTAFRRFIFVVFSAFLPILANGLRAYLIAVIGHLSDMKVAVGIDHFLYGWLFFGLTMTVAFLIGRIWRQDAVDTAESRIRFRNQPVRHPDTIRHPDTKGRLLAGVSAASLLSASIGPWGAAAYESVSVDTTPIDLRAPAGVAGWHIRQDRLWAWWPRVQRIDGEFYRFYSREDSQVALYVGQFRSQREGVQLFGSKNVLIERGYNPHSRRQRPANYAQIRTGKRDIEVVESDTFTPRVRGGAPTKLLIWRWYRLGGYYPPDNRYWVKLWNLWQVLTGGRTDAALIVVSTPYENDREAAARTLRSFIVDMLPEIERVLDASVSG